MAVAVTLLTKKCNFNSVGRGRRRLCLEILFLLPRLIMICSSVSFVQGTFIKYRTDAGGSTLVWHMLQSIRDSCLCSVRFIFPTSHLLHCFTLSSNAVGVGALGPITSWFNRQLRLSHRFISSIWVFLHLTLNGCPHL